MATIHSYKLTNKVISLICKIMENIGEVSTVLKYLDHEDIKKMNIAKTIQATCEIEGNSLSILDVLTLMRKQEIYGSAEDIEEIKNAIDAYSMIEDMDPYNVNDLLKIHEVMTHGLLKTAGSFRTKEEGRYEDDKVIYIAPDPEYVPELVNDLFKYIKLHEEDVYPLILSSLFHYELVYIHPFNDGNGRVARIWQTLILGKFNPLFYWIPIESNVKKHIEQYNEVINRCNKKDDCTEFIVFMLEMILLAVKEIRAMF